MVTADQLGILRGVTDAKGVLEHDPIELDGMTSTLTLRPANGEALSNTLAAVSRLGLAVWVRGGAHRAGVGNPPTRGDAILSMDRLAGVEEFEPSEGVCHVRAGTRLSDLREIVATKGWELPLDPPGERATVGGCIAAASTGPRALGTGLPRDCVLGLFISLASGERIRCGGRVVKNVTGYDFNKLYTGSFGTLGVIESAWLRLRPLPAHATSCQVDSADLAAACRTGIAAARCGFARAVAIGSKEDGGFRVVVELAGDASGVRRDFEWLCAEHGAERAADNAIDPVRERQAEMPALGGLRFCLGVLPSKLESALAELQRGGASLLAYPGLNLLYASYVLEASSDSVEASSDSVEASSDLVEASSGLREVEVIFREIARVAREAGGHFICEAAPSWAKAGRDMFGDLGSAASIIAALKQRFDPDGVLNPGRFAGRL
jgi:glycolate oxidase FAD binding subunit